MEKATAYNPSWTQGQHAFYETAVVLVDMHGFLKADTPCLG